jgi:hypothetical protein
VQVCVNGKISFLKAIKEIKTRLSAGKIMECVFWDSERVIRVGFLPSGITINHLKTEFLNKFILEFSSYLTGNMLCLRYKAQPVNAV